MKIGNNDMDQDYRLGMEGVEMIDRNGGSIDQKQGS